MNIEIAEGLVIGPNDRLVVNVKDSGGWEDGIIEEFNRELQQVIGHRFIILFGDMEIGKVEGA